MDIATIISSLLGVSLGSTFGFFLQRRKQELDHRENLIKSFMSESNDRVVQIIIVVGFLLGIYVLAFLYSDVLVENLFLAQNKNVIIVDYGYSNKEGTITLKFKDQLVKKSISSFQRDKSLKNFLLIEKDEIQILTQKLKEQ
jgi:hypothetical protein